MKIVKKVVAVLVCMALFCTATIPATAAMAPITLSNGDFDTYGDSTNWTLSGFYEVKYDEYAAVNSTYALNLWLSNDRDTYGSASYSVTLSSGEYAFAFDFSGESWNSGLSYQVTTGNGTVLASGDNLSGSGWDSWKTYTTSTFTLTETTTVTFTLSGNVAKSWWGYLDNLTLSGTGSIVSGDTSGSTGSGNSGASGTVIDDGEITVQTVDGLSDDFALGMDISSIVSEFKSGVTFQDYDGNTITNVTQFCQFLANDCGISHIRVRVWNDPYDANGNGYGGGNNDIDAAIEIAKGCAAAGLKMLIDFHYSDFWADPGKQTAPKAWTNYSLSQKSSAIAEFTTDALTQIRATDADVDMVQIGNETTAGVCGEWTESNMCTLFSSASAAVRAVDPSIRVVVHLTNPESGTMVYWAGVLDQYHVDYDILATSYYPYWHGTLSNLTSQMQQVRATYGKDVMVAETSYAYTLEDSDGWQNTVNEGANSTGMNYDFTPQGQANSVRDVINAVNEGGGIGVFYWEPAWITVGDIRGLSGDAYTQQWNANSALWETYGSGWASSYSYDYDPDDAGLWYGGSAVDNEAMFYPDGSPLPSLRVWQYVRGITSSEDTGDGATSTETSIDTSLSVSETETTFSDSVAGENTETETTSQNTPGGQDQGQGGGPGQGNQSGTQSSSDAENDRPTPPDQQQSTEVSSEFTETETVPVETVPENPNASSETEPSSAVVTLSYGDVTLDGENDMADVVFLAKMAANLVDSNDTQSELGDCNSDGMIGIADVQILLLFQAEVIAAIPI